jgi:putative ABC transport system substrate-binding protein
MRRRAFIAALGGVAAWPFVARAQQPKMPRVGWVWSGDPREIAGLKQGLRELGYVEGKNISIEYRFGDNSTERLLDLAAEIAHLKLDIILVCGTPATKATQRAAPGTPIVFMSGDPVGSGLVTSLRRPGGNLTGFSMMLLSEKWPDLVRDMLPAVNHIGYLWNPADVRSAGSFGQARRSAEMLGLVFDSYPVKRLGDLDDTFAAMARDRLEMLLIDPSNPYPTTLVSQLALQHKLPTISEPRDFVVAGGLMSYGASVLDTTRRMAHYLDKILKGESPADLPVEQPTRFELVINLKTAKALGLTIPPSLLARADEVIE